MARSKSVCKTWNSIISSPKFMDYYHKNLRQIEGNLLILFKHKYSDYKSENKFNFYTLSPSNGTVVDTDPLEYYLRQQYYMRKQPKPYEIESAILLGSCNGLVAILYNKTLILWNPLTKDQSFIRVKKNAVYDFESNFAHRFLFGLCYDSSKDEYVAVIGFEYQSPPVSPSNFDADIWYGGMQVYFYNFKYRSERLDFNQTEFRLLDRKLYVGDIGKVIRGLPHWVIQYYDFIHPIVQKDIFYFDLNQEKFKKVARPDASGDKTMLGLATLDGENQLGCVLHDMAFENLEVWVMKEYGNSESWSNMFTFPYMNMVHDCRSINYMNVLGFMPSGELIVYLDDKDLWVYDIHKGNPMEMKSEYISFDFVIVCEPKLISTPEPVVEIGDETEDEDGDEDIYEYKYHVDETYYSLYVNEVLYDIYVNEVYAKWSRLRSRVGKKTLQYLYA
ncbi:F-box protein CPR1-like [Silene latifolia]|uniref:F-box protein CPR1-like n=1 Tax=Silene latifolia TaxID=37657 RepID=UPI003D78A301